MERRQYEAIASMQESNWWYASRRHLLSGLLQRFGPFERVLEVGSGMGSNLEVLDAEERSVFASDFDLPALRWSLNNAAKPVHQADIAALPFGSGCFDLVVAMDVLEHVDDGAAIQEIHRSLRVGGRLVVTVPAHRYLWNDNDDASHHLRRYSKSMLCQLLSEFDIEHLAPWNFLAFLPMAAFAAWSRARSPRLERNNLERIPALANGLLMSLSKAENHLRRAVPMPIGTSYVAVVRRPELGVTHSASPTR